MFNLLWNMCWDIIIKKYRGIWLCLLPQNNVPTFHIFHIFMALWAKYTIKLFYDSISFTMWLKSQSESKLLLQCNKPYKTFYFRPQLNEALNWNYKKEKKRKKHQIKSFTFIKYKCMKRYLKTQALESCPYSIIIPELLENQYGKME